MMLGMFCDWQGGQGCAPGARLPVQGCVHVKLTTQVQHLHMTHLVALCKY